MGNRIIGRENEIRILRECYNSGKAELVAVYGRRRIGKTFLVKNLLMDKFDFFVTGMFEGSLKEELAIWNQKLSDYSCHQVPVAKSWMEAFSQLKQYIQTLNKERIVVFRDCPEMPHIF